MMHAFSSDRFKLPARLFYCKIFRIGDVSTRPPSFYLLHINLSSAFTFFEYAFCCKGNFRFTYLCYAHILLPFFCMQNYRNCLASFCENSNGIVFHVGKFILRKHPCEIFFIRGNYFACRFSQDICLKN